MTNNTDISDIIQNVFYDIKAEALISDLISNGLKYDDFLVIQKGIFKRRYARDIDFIEDIVLKSKKKVTGFFINRDGLYDSLPDGLFHEKSIEKGKQENISEESKRLKKEEEDARNFFLPFENEIFLQRIKLEQEERKMLFRFTENLFDEIYPEFWNFDKSLNNKYISRMTLLLHFSHKIAGNISLTEKSLESIINEKIVIDFSLNDTLQSRTKTNKTTISEDIILGNVVLGVDFVCGDNFNDMGKTMVINIGPLKNTSVDEYVEKGSISEFLQYFTNYFVPFGIDTDFNIIVDKQEQNFILSNEKEGAVLGYNSAI